MPERKPAEGRLYKGKKAKESNKSIEFIKKEGI